jgi:hypothetical protein
MDIKADVRSQKHSGPSSQQEYEHVVYLGFFLLIRETYTSYLYLIIKYNNKIRKGSMVWFFPRPIHEPWPDFGNSTFRRNYKDCHR